MRLVLDTSVLVSAFRSREGASYQLMLLAYEGAYEMLATPALFFEYEDVLTRVEQQLAHGLGVEEIDVVLRGLARLSVPVRVHYRVRPQLVDPGDELVLEAAVNGRADLLVTHNTRDFAGIEGMFPLRVVRPSDALKEI